MDITIMNILTLLLGISVATAATTTKQTSTKTKVDIRVVRQSNHGGPYVLSPQIMARAEEQQSEEEHMQAQHHQPVSVITEGQYQALLKQAQKALQGYDITKLQQHLETPTVEHRQPKALVHKPEVSIKYVYTDAPTSITYNSAPAAYNSGSHTSKTSYTSSAKAYSAVEDEQHGYNHYSSHKFGYRVHDPHSGAAFGHSEVSEGHVTRGHYHVLLPDGRLQNVKYVADPSGYHATVSYETYKHV